MYNASNYPESTIDTFELLGSKVVGVFYNHIYEKAQELHSSGKTSSVTEAYKVVVPAYLGHFHKEELFKKTLSDIYTHFNHYSPVPALTYSHFVDSVTREFVPTDYWPGLNAKRKDRILGTALENSYKKLSEYMVSQEGLKKVIDNHKDRANIAYLQTLMVQILIEERERLYQKFIKPIVGSTSAVTERLRNDLQKSIKQVKILKEALQKASAEIKAQTAAAAKQATTIENLEAAKAWLIDRARQVEMRSTSGSVVAAPAQPAAAPASVQEMPPVSYVQEDGEFDPYAEIEDLVEEAVVETVEEQEPEISAEEMKKQAKQRRQKRRDNVKADDLGF